MLKADLLVYDHGSVWTVEAASPHAEDWVRENVATDTPRLFTGDWRPMRDLVEGAQRDGLVVLEA